MMAQGNPVPTPESDWSGYAWRPFQDPQTKALFKTAAPDAYLASNQWASGVLPSLNFTLPFGFFGVLEVPMSGVRISLDVVDRERGVNGRLGGVIETEALVQSFKKVAGAAGAQFCGESAALEGILDSVRQASDIMKDGTQNPDAVCDGISIGLGFETRRSLLGEPTPAPLPTDPCEDAQ
jgi:hypothetical protein